MGGHENLKGRKGDLATQVDQTRREISTKRVKKKQRISLKKKTIGKEAGGLKKSGNP